MEVRHILMAVGVALIWALNFIAVKVALIELTPFTLGALRFIAAIFPFIFFLKRPKISWYLLIAIGITLGFLKFAMMFVGIKLGLPMGLSALVLQTQILFTMLFSYLFFHHRFAKHELIGITVSFIGVILIGLTVDGHSTFLGFLLLLGAACAWGVANILLKKAGKVDTLSLIVWMSLIPPLPFALSSYWADGTEVLQQNISWASVTSVLYIAWVSTLLGYTWWTKLIKLYSPSQVGAYGLLIPIFCIFFGWLFLNEVFTVFHFIAGIMVICGLIINQGFLNKRKIFQSENDIKKAA